MEVYIDDRQTKVKLDKNIIDLLTLVAKESLKLENIKENYEISISFVDNEEIRELNNIYRGIDTDTDVLSFPMDADNFVPSPLLGDIIISVEKALEQAVEYGHDLRRELAYLTAHSMLHLLGYDHMEKNDKMMMRDKEKLIMKNIEVFKEDKGENIWKEV